MNSTRTWPGPLRDALGLVALGGFGSAFLVFIFGFDPPRDELEASLSLAAFPFIIPLGIMVWVVADTFPVMYAVIGVLQIIALVAGLSAARVGG